MHDKARTKVTKRETFVTERRAGKPVVLESNRGLFLKQTVSAGTQNPTLR